MYRGQLLERARYRQRTDEDAECHLTRELREHLACVDLEADGHVWTRLNCEREDELVYRWGEAWKLTPEEEAQLAVLETVREQVIKDLMSGGPCPGWYQCRRPKTAPARTERAPGRSLIGRRSAPTFKQLANQPSRHSCPMLISLATTCERFDRRLLAAEFARVELADPIVPTRESSTPTHCLCADEPRSLDAALQFYGVQEGHPRQAHDARSDVEATVAVLAAQFENVS